MAKTTRGSPEPASLTWCEKLTDDRRRTPSDGNSSLCQRQGELKTTNNDQQNTTLKTKDRVTRTPLKNKNELRYIPLYNNWLKTMYFTDSKHTIIIS